MTGVALLFPHVPIQAWASLSFSSPTPAHSLHHSGAGHCTYQCALSAAADLEGAGRGEPSPLPAF